jgi:hypothetical protein
MWLWQLDYQVWIYRSPIGTVGGNGSAGISGFFFMTIQLENNMGSYPNLVIKKNPEIPAEPFPPTVMFNVTSINVSVYIEC